MLVWAYMTAQIFSLSKTQVNNDCHLKPSCHESSLPWLEAILTLWLLIVRTRIKHFSYIKCYFEPMNIERMITVPFLVIAVVASAQKEAGVHTRNESPLYVYNQLHINWLFQAELKGPLTVILFTHQCRCPWRAIVSWNICICLFQVPYRNNKIKQKKFMTEACLYTGEW
jgi:hypothetical protein